MDRPCSLARTTRGSGRWFKLAAFVIGNEDGLASLRLVEDPKAAAVTGIPICTACIIGWVI